MSIDEGRTAGQAGQGRTDGGPPLGDIVEMLRRATGEDGAWAGRVTPTSRLEDDLELDSLELTTLDSLLRRRYGPGVDLAGHLSSLELDDLIALTVGDLHAYVDAAVAATSGREPS